ncbi:glutamine amidotransferase [Endomicrobiia bacterium]|uniref:Anthranilate synthase n=1 Tax=Endomicrobium trichonymphae TaxID=1408204 RepID=B1GZB8_ENDTX|nr:aminodeoxychorismate/anthranilate synthase component II [Candidatus Endomicrobium trichonymphae]GHT05250.1 glutamine amidotransferase [Endomicrobiia bacterium]BAG13600.1 anthranilate synthase [Candidatus Endomicrobium trichonymphae]BAV58682.1 anthranilate synthase [Candidatus Endomicrobium trichonymphae]GHT13884.1 glutamine amidotransferase [Endomicrobiia bacterium]GHT16663.1 glutamine amidotransferase [Endomicrobiia bacterium]
MILIIDNYDSFSYNLYQYVGTINKDVKVIKNDEMTVKEIEELNATNLIISPGPGRPDAAGVCEETIKYFKGKIPILGVCLGHQAICEVFGAKITYAKTLKHGKTSDIHIANGSPVFKGLSPVLRAARYHSLIADRATIPDELLVIAEDEESQVMGVKHQDCDLYGLQFHPESVLTKNGMTIIENFLSLRGTR